MASPAAGYHTVTLLIVRLLWIGSVSAAGVMVQEPVYTVRVDVPLVSVDVAVFDGQNRPVGSLGREDFLLYEDGVLQDIRNFSPVATPYNVLLLFDRSGSTQGQWLLMQRAVAGFLSHLRPQDRAAIAAFDEDFKMLLEWKDGRDKAISALDQLTRPSSSAGGTDFYEAVERAVGREFRNVTGRRAVIVLTDGRDSGFYRRTVANNRVASSAEDNGFQRVIRAVQKEKVPVYFIATNTDRNLDLRDVGADYFKLQTIYPRSSLPDQFLMEARLRLEQIADSSGGRVFFPASMRDAVPLYEQISRELSTSYSLGYIPNGRPPERAYRRIEIRTRDANQKVWQSREGYYGQ